MPTYKFKRQEEATYKEILTMILMSKEPRVKALISFLYLYGCRITEALNLHNYNITITDSHIISRIGVLKRRGHSGGPYESMPHLLSVRLDAPFVQEYLLPYQKQLGKDSKVFPFSRQLAWLRIKKVNPLYSPHVFRHDRIMKLALKGASEAELMDWAGWTDIRPASNYVRATGRLAIHLTDKIE